ncbi:cytochrome c [Halomonas sp. H10-9-1]|uniref:c-type cytochrome n=1 Tax=Halomonas sp. H10-9-1 TaxID=2950871 RepID=UPI0032E02C16
MQNTTTVPSRHLPSRTLGALALAGALLLPPVAHASEAREPSEAYRQVCAHCHAPDKAVGPEITIAFPEAAWEARGNYIRNTVRHGRAAMPAFRAAKISDPELEALIQALVSGELDDAPVADASNSEE